MVEFVIFASLMFVWLGFILLVKRENGWVGISQAAELRLRVQAAIARFGFVVGDSLLPALRAMTAEMVKVNKTLERAGWHRVGAPGEPPFENDWTNK